MYGIKEVYTWARTSWTVWFNILVALMGIFADNLAVLSGVTTPKIYAILAISVPMINFLLRLRTQSKLNVRKVP